MQNIYYGYSQKIFFGQVSVFHLNQSLSLVPFSASALCVYAFDMENCLSSQLSF